jgi:hypothetical protein
LTGSRLCSPWPRAGPYVSRHYELLPGADPSLMRLVGPNLAMAELPATLAAVEPQARAIYRSGWRPPMPDGPTRDDLVELITPLTAAR